MDALKILKQRYNRPTYWLGVLLVVMAMAVAVRFDASSALFGVLLLLLFANRLHDIGLSGWFAVLFVLALLVISAMAVAEQFSEQTAGIFGLIMIGCVVLIGMFPGQKSANKWGDRPNKWIQFYQSE